MQHVYFFVLSGAGSVNALLRMKLLGLPASFWKIRRTKPAEQNQMRLTKFLALYSSLAADGRLRIACLCFQLTARALNITAQSAAEHGAQLFRLVRGDVQPKNI